MARCVRASLFVLAALPACGGGGGDDGSATREPVTVSTLAYVVTECRADAQGGTMRQSLQIRRGDQAPITVVAHFNSTSTPVLQVLCDGAGRGRAHIFLDWGVFHRLGVSRDGAQVVFEVTDDQGTLFPANFLSAEQEGFFVVRADGSGLRRLGAASREPPYGGLTIFDYNWAPLAFSPDGRMVTYTDRGPSLDNEDAIQIFTLDLASGDARQITRLPPAPGARAPCGPTGCPFFNDDQTITFRTNANLDGTNPGGQNVIVTVRTDGSGLTISPPIAVIPGSSLVTVFQISGSDAGAALLTLPGVPVNLPPGVDPLLAPIREVFFIDGQNVLQLTHFGRADTLNPTLSPDGQRVFIVASADPFLTNPTENCQIFSIHRHGGDLQQLTSFSESPDAKALGCGLFERPRGCAFLQLGFEPHTGALVFISTCDPFGTNPYGNQIFAMRPDGTGLRQLTSTQPYAVDPGGAVSVELPFPFAHPGTPGIQH